MRPVTLAIVTKPASGVSKEGLPRGWGVLVFTVELCKKIALPGGVFAIFGRQGAKRTGQARQRQ